jgi:hypothetical protein
MVRTKNTAKTLKAEQPNTAKFEKRAGKGNYLNSIKLFLANKQRAP